MPKQSKPKMPKSAGVYVCCTGSDLTVVFKTLSLYMQMQGNRGPRPDQQNHAQRRPNHQDQQRKPGGDSNGQHSDNNAAEPPSASMKHLIGLMLDRIGGYSFWHACVIESFNDARNSWLIHLFNLMINLKPLLKETINNCNVEWCE